MQPCQNLKQRLSKEINGCPCRLCTTTSSQLESHSDKWRVPVLRITVLGTKCLCTPIDRWLKPQCDGIWRWDLWKIIRLAWKWDPMVGLISLLEGRTENFLSAMLGLQSPPRTECVGTFILDFPVSLTVKNEFIRFLKI
jgi:hypothetical protein